eukprot:6558582-Lingulodinium_polyedra.AAC.1
MRNAAGGRAFIGVMLAGTLSACRNCLKSKSQVRHWRARLLWPSLDEQPSDQRGGKVLGSYLLPNR